MNKEGFSNKSFKTVAYTGMAMVVVLLIVAFLYDRSEGTTGEGSSKALYYFSIFFALLHLVIYSVGARQKNKITRN